MSSIEPSQQINCEDSSLDTHKQSDDLHTLQIQNESLLTELESLRMSNQIFQSELKEKTKGLIFLNHQKVEALKQNTALKNDILLVSSQRDSLRDEIYKLEVDSREREAELVREKEEIRSELEVSKERIKELLNEKNEEIKVWKSFKECLIRVSEELGEEKVGNVGENMREELKLSENLGEFGVEIKEVLEVMNVVEWKLSEYKEKWKKERREKEVMNSELEVSKERLEELSEEKSENIRVLNERFEVVKSVKQCLSSVTEALDEEKVEHESKESEEMREELQLGENLGDFSEALKVVFELVSVIELKFREYKEKWRKEKRELENSVVSLTEENRDVNSLLRIALVEKEAVERRLKGNNEQKRGAILQIAERGLQKVGFGFMMGGGASESLTENSGADTSVKSEGSECEVEPVSLASTVERIMKNLRLEITQLRRSLEESRSDIARLQSLTENQAQQLAENSWYIGELEHRETMLAENVEELLVEIKETEEEVARWREACELEVEAGKRVIEERDEVVAILKQELEKTKASLEISNGKWKLKEELAADAMAAQEAAEKSLQLADNRTAELRERIEELTGQVEGTEKRDQRKRPKVRHICWPWRALKLDPANSRSTNIRHVKRMLPEMQALLL